MTGHRRGGRCQVAMRAAKSCLARHSKVRSRLDPGLMLLGRKMRNANIVTIFVLAVMLAGSNQCFASDSKSDYLHRLERIHHVSGDGDNQLFTLIGDASIELKKHWSPRLAREVARVFNELLDVNQNYFLVELIDPVAEARPDQFVPILDKVLSKKNKVLYRQLLEMDRREEREGNG